MEVDYQLIADVRRLITGSNVHRIGSWILIYEMSQPDSANRDKYEAYLRDLAQDGRRCMLARERAKAAIELSRKALCKSDAIDRRIEKLRRMGSD